MNQITFQASEEYNKLDLVFTGPGPLRTRRFLQLWDHLGLAWDSQYPTFYRSGIARDWLYLSFHKSGIAIRHTPVFSGPGLLGTGPGLAVPQFVQVRDCLPRSARANLYFGAVCGLGSSARRTSLAKHHQTMTKIVARLRFVQSSTERLIRADAYSLVASRIPGSSFTPQKPVPLN